MTVAEITADLRAEQETLDGIVAGLGDDDWSTPTPSPGWAVADQVAHLTYFDGTATTAITDADAFHEANAALFEGLADGTIDMDEATLSWSRNLSLPELIERWRANRARLLEAAGTLDEGTRVAWYGPSMGAKSFLTARLMETWAHGQDIVDAVGASRPPTDRLRHIAQLGVITHGWSYVNRGLDAPTVPVRVDLTAPSGARWTWNETATESVAGPAEDFCLVVTQRRRLDDTDLVVTGHAARDWMEKAQAFAGGPTNGPT